MDDQHAETTALTKPKKKRQKNEILSHEPINLDPQSLLAIAIKEKAPIETFKSLLDISERLQKSEAEKQFRYAMSAFQAECPSIPKKKKVQNKDGKSTRYKFAAIEDIFEIVRPLFDKHGLSYDIEPKVIIENGQTIISVTVKAYHIMGHHKESTFAVPVDMEAYMSDPQKFASAQTFAKRYAFCNAFGIITADEDDDTNAIAKEQEEKRKEDDKQKQEKMEKLQKLSEHVKDGLRILGYKAGAAYLFCDKFGWDEKRIKAEIEKIVNMKDGVANYANTK